MRSICLLVLLMLLAVAMTAPPAGAGGSWIEVVEVSDGALSPPDGGPAWASVGAAVTMRGGFCAGQQANPSQGPWFATLRPETGGPPTPLGSVEIITGDGGACPWIATASFTVPTVRIGSYWVDVCDEGCTTGVGDLVGGYIVVASSATEARLVQRVTRLEVRYAHVRRNAKIFRQRSEDLAARIADVRNDARRLELQLEQVSASEEQAIQDLRHSTQAAARAEANSDRWRMAAVIASFILMLGASALVISRRRGHLRAPAIRTAS